MNIEMIHSPRATGKTTTLKLRIAERFLDPMNGDFRIVVLAPKRNMVHTYIQWAKNLDLPISTSLQALRGCRETKLYIFIDEPFMMDIVEQNRIIEELRLLEARNTIELLGIGTKPTEHIPPFERYIE